MVPEINDRGHSFTKLTQYLMNPKREDPSQTPRVGGASVHNMHTENVFEAADFMAWTDMNRLAIREAAGGDRRGAPATAGNVYHTSLAWHPKEDPTWEHMQERAHAYMAAQGLEEHQYYLVQHIDEPHPHVHICVNLVHPTTGIIAQPWGDRKIASRWANEYEKEHGVFCDERAAKYEELEQKRPENRLAKIRETVTTCYEKSDSGQAFAVALQTEGFTLAQGQRRFLTVVDRQGEIYSLNKLIELQDKPKGISKGKVINAKIVDLDRDALAPADELAVERKSPEREAPEPEKRPKQDHSPVITACFQKAKDGREFAAALEDHQLMLTLGRRRGFQVVDARGEVHPVTANVILEEGKKTPYQTVNAKLKDIDKGALEKADDIRAQRLEQICLEVEEAQAQVDVVFDREQQEIDQQNALLDAADAHAEVAAEAAPAPHTGRTRLRLEQFPTTEEQREALRAHREEIAAFKREVAKKMQQSREKWHIDEHQKARDQAFEALEEVSGWWSRHIFHRAQYRDAYDQYQNAENQLQERTARFKHDIEAFHARKPELLRKALEKQGVDPEIEMPSRDEKTRDLAIEKKLEALRQKVREEEAQRELDVSPPLPVAPEKNSEIEPAGQESPANDNVEQEKLAPEPSVDEQRRRRVEKAARDFMRHQKQAERDSIQLTEDMTPEERLQAWRRHQKKKEERGNDHGLGL